MSPTVNEKDLLNRIAELPREISPGRDPWPEISARMDQPGGRMGHGAPARRWLFGAAAAAVVLAFSAALLLKTGPVMPPRGDGQVASSDSWPEGARTPGLLAASEAEYQAAFREFIPVGDSRQSLTPQTVEKIEMGWMDLQSTETALTAALEANPDSRFLHSRMLELRARQLGFLKQLASLDLNNRRMTI